MKKGKVRTQLRKIATRDAIEKRRGGKSVDPFEALVATTKRYNPVTAKDYNNEEEQDYGF